MWKVHLRVLLICERHPLQRNTSRLASFFPSISSKNILSPMATSESSERVSCTVDECNTTFSRQADMERHLAEHHGPVKRCHLPDCPWEGARRSSRVQEHMKKAHPEIYDGIFCSQTARIYSNSAFVCSSVECSKPVRGYFCAK